MKVKYAIFAILSMFLGVLSVSASTYTPTTDSLDNSRLNSLIDMAYNQIDRFTDKKYATFQVDYDYYLVCSEDVTVNSNNIVFNNATIIRAQRSQTGYNYYYDYSTYTETSAVVTLSYLITSNVPATKTIGSTKYDQYKHNKEILRIAVFVLGLLFAIFLVRGRSYL